MDRKFMDRKFADTRVIARNFCGAVCFVAAGVAGADELPALTLIDLPDGLAKDVGRAPDRLEGRVVELIGAYGQDGAIDADGLQLSVAVERAAARAGAMRRLIALDLDGDLAISADESAAALGVLAAGQRGKVLRALSAADGDGDGALSLSEMQSAGQAAALRAVDDVDAAERLALAAFDADGDARVSLTEVRAAVQTLALLADAAPVTRPRPRPTGI